MPTKKKQPATRAGMPVTLPSARATAPTNGVRVGGYLRVPRNVAGMPPARVRVVALGRFFAVHRAVADDGPGFTVSHILTGLAAAYRLPLSKARRAMREFDAIPGRWNFTDPAKLSKRQKAAGGAIKARYMGW